jgi:hypothetical protein
MKNITDSIFQESKPVSIVVVEQWKKRSHKCGESSGTKAMSGVAAAVRINCKFPQ